MVKRGIFAHQHQHIRVHQIHIADAVDPVDECQMLQTVNSYTVYTKYVILSFLKQHQVFVLVTNNLTLVTL